MVHNTDFIEDADIFNNSVNRINNAFGKVVIGVENTEGSDTHLDIYINGQPHTSDIYHEEVWGFLNGFNACLDISKESKL